MIIPTSDFDPLFADDGVPFSEKMRQYIRREFGDLLGSYGKLLESEQGLETLQIIYSRPPGAPSNQRMAG